MTATRFFVVGLWLFTVSSLILETDSCLIFFFFLSLKHKSEWRDCLSTEKLAIFIFWPSKMDCHRFINQSNFLALLALHLKSLFTTKKLFSNLYLEITRPTPRNHHGNVYRIECFWFICYDKIILIKYFKFVIRFASKHKFVLANSAFLHFFKVFKRVTVQNFDYSVYGQICRTLFGEWWNLPMSFLNPNFKKVKNIKCSKSIPCSTASSVGSLQNK